MVWINILYLFWGHNIYNIIYIIYIIQYILWYVSIYLYIYIYYLYIYMHHCCVCLSTAFAGLLTTVSPGGTLEAVPSFTMLCSFRRGANECCIHGLGGQWGEKIVLFWWSTVPFSLKKGRSQRNTFYFFKHLCRRWFQTFLFSPRSLGKWFPIWLIFLKWVETIN